MVRLSDAAFDQAMKWNVYANFWATRRALAAMALLLASDAGAGITGAILSVDGGTAQYQAGDQAVRVERSAGARIAPLLPGKASDPGRTASDNRLFVNGCLWVLATLNVDPS